ncbi:MAG: hypothetical protein QOH88_3475 [Verrucomicrobiota bacterium]|jgi:SAM-dependent methyltransferase
MNEQLLVPPEEALFDGTSTHPEFKQIGDNFAEKILKQRAGLLPGHRVLDIGSGNGQKARPLAGYLEGEGGYDGIEVVQAGVDWCQQAYSAHPNFHFHRADVRNQHYNPGGTISPEDYKLPFADETFDLVLLSSVFTHMLPEGLENYFSEITRMLKPGGRSVITYFLWNDEAAEKIAQSENPALFSHVFRAEVCRVYAAEKPEQAVCYYEDYIRSLYRQHGHNVAEVTYGFWCGRKDIMRCQQEIIISVK